MDDSPDIPFGGSFYHQTFYDSVTGKIFVITGDHGSGAFFNTATDTWGGTKNFANTSVPNSCAAYDPTRSRGISIGVNTNVLYAFNFSTETVSTSPLSPSGATSILGGRGLSCFYDPIVDVYWILGGDAGGIGWSNIYEMNASTFAITQHPLSSTIATFSGAVGSFGRYVFMSTNRAIGIVGSHNQPAVVVRLPGSITPDTTSWVIPTWPQAYVYWWYRPTSTMLGTIHQTGHGGTSITMDSTKVLNGGGELERYAMPPPSNIFKIDLTFVQTVITGATSGVHLSTSTILAYMRALIGTAICVRGERGEA